MHALKNAAQIAKNFKAKVTLMNVYSFPQPSVPAPYAMAGSPMISIATIQPEMLSKLTEAQQKVGNNILANGKEKAQALWGVQAETLLKEGHAVEEILKTAREGKYDLIAIGARGLSTIKEILLGSVSHGVVIHASCPVLVVK